MQALKSDNKYTINDNGCWIRNVSLDKDGYSRIYHNGKLVRGHRLMYELYRGEIPNNLVIDHLCRVKSCINPQHLEPVSVAENTRRGKTAKLTQELIKQVKRLRSRGLSQAKIAHIIGVHQSQISRVLRGVTWGNKI